MKIIILIISFYLRGETMPEPLATMDEVRKNAAAMDNSRYVASSRVKEYMKTQGWRMSGVYLDEKGDMNWTDKEGKKQKRLRANLPTWIHESAKDAGE